MLDLLEGSCLKKQLDGFFQIQAGFLDGLPLTGDVDFRAQGNVRIILAFNNRCELPRIVHNRLPSAELAQ
jgi:hypothetical protein